jgi:hypothetical protein
MSLRARFTLLIGGLTAVVLLLFAGAFLYSERRHLLSQVEKVQGAKADLLAHACGQARLSRDQLTVLSLFKELMKSPGFVEAMCVDAAGKVILHSSLARIGNDVWGRRFLKPYGKRLSSNRIDPYGLMTHWSRKDELCPGPVWCLILAPPKRPLGNIS